MSQQSRKTGRFTSVETKLIISKYRYYGGDEVAVVNDKEIKNLNREPKSIRNKISHLRKQAKAQGKGAKTRSKIVNDNSDISSVG
jgi:hypothetical protein